MPATLSTHEQLTIDLIQEEGFAALTRPAVARDLVLTTRYVYPSKHPILQAARKLFADLPQTEGAKVELFSIGGEDYGAVINVNLPHAGDAIVSLPANIDQIADALNSVSPAFHITLTTGLADLAQARIKRYASRGGVYTVTRQFSTNESLPFNTLGEALTEAVAGLSKRMFPYEGKAEFRFDA